MSNSNFQNANENNPNKNVIQNENKSENKPKFIKKLIQANTTKRKVFSLNDLGKISLAKIHASANRPLHKINDLTNEVNFCQCCNLPQETKNIIESFKFCDDPEKFAECGVGTYLYFHYFEFALFIMVIVFCMSAAPTIILTHHYTKGLNRLCNNYYDEYKNVNDYPSCKKFVSHAKGSEYYQNDTDWVLRFNSNNIKYYRLIYKEFTNGNNEVDQVLVNYSIINFFCLMTLFVVNIVYIVLLKAKGTEVDIKNISPRDYTILCVNLNNALEAYNYYKNLPTSNYFKDATTDVDKFNLFLQKELILSNEGKILNIESTNLCYKLNDFMELEKKLEVINEQLFLIQNNKEQLELNKKNGKNDINEMSYYSGRCCFKSEKSYKELVDEKESLNTQIKKVIDEREQLTKENFAGCLLVTFKTIKDAENFYNEFPQTFLYNLWILIKNLRYYLFSCCYSKEEIDRFHRRKKMKVYHAPEPEDIIWENLEFTNWNRFQKSLKIYGISFLLIAVSVGIVIGLTYVQNKSNDGQWSQNTFIKYGISLIITGVISIINTVFQWVLDYLTKLEHQRTKTEYYLSFSVKLTVFTFLNSAVIPLIGNYIQYEWGENDNLINNMTTIFISNAFLTPLLWTFNINFIIKRIKIYFLEKKDNPDSQHNLTQKKLNLLYEYPSMDISYKYSYIAKTMLMTFLYIPIFPLGVPISLAGLILGYLLEKYNFTHLYKRPEMLNQKMCEFYMNYFIVFLFDYGVGNWMFMNDTFPIKDWALVNIILFGILIIIPYPHLFNCKFIENPESDINKKEYKDVYFSFYNDYERQNPLTKKQGLCNYLKRLLDDGKITQRTYSIAIKNIENLNIMQMYYHSSLTANIIQAQKSLANSYFYNNNNKLDNNNLNYNSNNNNNNDIVNIGEYNSNYINPIPSLDEQILMAFGGYNENYEIENQEERHQNGNNGNIDNYNGYNVIQQYNNPFFLNMGYTIGFNDFMENNYINENQGNNLNNNYVSNNYNDINLINPNHNQMIEMTNINQENIYNNQGYYGGAGVNINNNNVYNNNSHIPFNNEGFTSSNFVQNNLNSNPYSSSRFKSSVKGGY